MNQMFWAYTIASLCLSTAAFSAESTQSTTSTSTSTELKLTQSERTTLTTLGLTTSDWLRFKEISSSPLATWYSADQDPIMVLGITARSQSERDRFAALYVEADRRRTQAQLDFSKAVGKVWQTKYGHEKLFAYTPEATSSPVPTLAASDRVILVFDANVACAICAEAISTVQAVGKSNGSTGLDLYFTSSTREQVIAYGRAMGLTPEEVSTKRITLNMATPEIMATLGVTGLPAAFRRRGKAIEALTIEQITQ